MVRTLVRLLMTGKRRGRDDLDGDSSGPVPKSDAGEDSRVLVSFARGYPYTTAVVWLITGLSVPGLVLMAWRCERATYFLAVLLVYPLMYYVVVTDMRYRYPILWISALAAGYAASFCKSRIRSPKPLLM